MRKPRAAASPWVRAGSLVLLLAELAGAQPADPSAASIPASDRRFSLAVERDEAAAACPEPSWFEARVAAHAGKSSHAGHFKLLLGRRAAKWHARIQLWESSTDAPHAERVLEDRSQACLPLAEAAAVTIAILADDSARRAAPETPPGPAAAPPAPSRVEPPRPAPPRPRVWVGVGGGAALGFISPVAPTLGFSVGLDASRFRAGLRLMMTTEQEFELDPGRVFVQSWLGTLLGCWHAEGEHFGAALCGAFDGSLLRASAEGFDDGRPSSRRYFAAGLEAQPTWIVSDRYRISAALGAFLPFTRESFSVTGRGVAYLPPRLNWKILIISEIGAF